MTPTPLTPRLPPLTDKELAELEEWDDDPRVRLILAEIRERRASERDEKGAKTT